MNGVHDLGGMHNLGPIEIERDEPWFHHEWERRAFAITLAAGALGEWSLDATRFARERMPAADYLRATYYEKWLWGLERLLCERGLVGREDIDARMRSPGDAASAPARPPHAKCLRADEVQASLAAGTPTRVDIDIPARFAVGDRIVTRNEHPLGHTRLPRYARGRRGVVVRDHGVFVFADANAMGRGEQPQHLYGVVFATHELWGESAAPRDSVYIDLWESHLDPA